MMFKSRFHAGIANGQITRTFRYWKRPQAKAGGIYRVGAGGYVRVTAVVVVDEAGLEAGDAKASGFGSVAAMREYLAPYAGTGRRLYRVDFRYAGDVAGREPDRRAITSSDEMDAIDKALDLRDRNSKTGPWTRDTLALVARRPGMSSAAMAKTLRREQMALKQDMRKLKKLGLTISLETGYELSPRGRSYFDARKRDR